MAAIALAEVTFVLVQIIAAKEVKATLVIFPCPAVPTVKGKFVVITPAAETATLVAPVTVPLTLTSRPIRVYFPVELMPQLK